MRLSWNATGVGSTAKLSPANNPAPAYARSRVIGRKGESLSPAAERSALVSTRGRFGRNASRTGSDAARRNGAGSQMLKVNHPRIGLIFRTFLACVLGLIVIAASGLGQGAWAEGRSDFISQARVLETGRLGHPSPAGLAFSDKADNFLILDAPDASQSAVSDFAQF